MKFGDFVNRSSKIVTSPIGLGQIWYFLGLIEVAVIFHVSPQVS